MAWRAPNNQPNECIFQKPLFGCADARSNKTRPTTNGRIWRRDGEAGGGRKKFLSLSWHDKSVCISTPFITSHPRQWIEFQKPINKGDVHSAWQLSQAGVPLSFSPILHFLLLLSPFFFLVLFCFIFFSP